MTRVSLREAYDNKDVVAQIYAIRDTAESAEDTAEQAVTTANTASDHVDALVPQVEGAVANANSASASAQASAQTVAGYENRLATVEDAAEDLAGDLNSVTLRVTTAEGNIVTIQGRVTALETADGQNVKINNINQYAIGLTGNQNSTGTKGFSAIKTPYIEVQNNFRPVIYYGDYDGSDVQSANRIRPITVFTSPNSTQKPILRMETIDDETITGVELTTTIYNSGVNRGISIYARKSDGMAYMTAPSRGSTNISDYPSNEVVTIETLRKLGLIQ